MQTPIVLLHGLFGHAKNWTSFTQEMGDKYRFIVPGLPIQKGRIQLYDNIDIITEFLYGYLFRQEKVILCGNSLGGQVAIDFTLKYPEKVAKLVLAGSAGLGENNLANGKRPKLSRAMVRNRTTEVFYNNAHVTDDLIDETYSMLNDRKTLRSILRLAKDVRDRNMGGELHKLDLPTLLVWGMNDNITPMNVAEEFRNKIKNSILYFIGECGHAPQIEQPEEFAKIMRDFI